MFFDILSKNHFLVFTVVNGIKVKQHLDGMKDLTLMDVFLNATSKEYSIYFRLKKYFITILCYFMSFFKI